MVKRPIPHDPPNAEAERGGPLESQDCENRKLLADNARLRRELAEAKRTNRDLSNFLSSAQTCAIALNGKLEVTLVTRAAKDIFRLKSDIVGSPIDDVDTELLQHDLRTEACRVLETQRTAIRQLQTRENRTISRHALPFWDETGALLGVVVTFEDITHRREASIELSQKNRRLELAWEAARGGVFEHRVPLDSSTYVSEQWAQVLGYRHEDLPEPTMLLRWLADQAHPEDREKWEDTYQEVLVGKADRYSIELRFRHRFGHYIWVRKIAKVLARDKEGRARHMLRMMIDITDLKQVEASLKESEERFRTMASNISQLAWMADGKGWIFWYNRRWYEYTGTTLDQMQGWGWRAVHHPDHVERVVEKVSKCFATGALWEDTFPLRGADGQYRWFLSRAVPIRDESGRVTRWFGTNTDVTELRQVEEKLVEAGRQKDEFLAMLGHELRNPLAAIRTASELLKFVPEGNAALKKSQEILQRQTSHMAKLLDGLLDVSRIVQGKIKLDPELLDLAAVCREVIHDIRRANENRLVAIEGSGVGEAIWVPADRVRVTQIVSNLLTNAMKFTPDGGLIELTLREAEDHVELRVKDNGIGIEESLLPHIFEIFRQSDQSLDRAHGGLGLGLALVRTLVDLHGGTIEARSDGPHQGAEFSLRLPTREATPLPLEKSEHGWAAPLRVLLIEDNEDAAELLGDLLRNFGHVVFAAHRGARGIELVYETRPHVVLCDVGLPGMSGLEVARRVRADPALNEVKLVALSGYGRLEDKTQCRDAGFDAHLTKPLDTDALCKTLSRLFKKPAADGNAN